MLEPGFEPRQSGSSLGTPNHYAKGKHSDKFFTGSWFWVAPTPLRAGFFIYISSNNTVVGTPLGGCEDLTRGKCLDLCLAPKMHKYELFQHNEYFLVIISTKTNAVFFQHYLWLIISTPHITINVNHLFCKISIYKLGTLALNLDLSTIPSKKWLQMYY